MTDRAADPGPFSRFEFLVAGRYLRARRRDRFVSVIAALTLTGMALGVAALIVVTSVMNGFNAEIISKLLGLILGLVFAFNVEAIRSAVSNFFNISIFPPELFLMSSLPSRVDMHEVTLVVLLSLGLTFLATLYPAWRAARLDPIEGLNQ